MAFDINRATAEFSYGLPITIEGIGLDTRAADIPEEVILSSSPQKSDDLVERGDAYFRVLENGSEIQLSPTERYRMVLADGGWLSSAHITWKIVDGKVSCYFIKGDLLDRFHIASESDIVERFGRPECVLINGIGKEYNYMSRKLKILWSMHESRLYSVDVGDFRVPEMVREEDAENGVFHIGGVRRVTMTSLRQDHTYSGLISGMPNKAINDRIIEDLKASAVADMPRLGKPYFIAPTRRRITARKESHHGTSEMLPGVRCVAELTSSFPANDFEHSGSCVVLVWFQSRMAMPIDREIIEEIELLNWCELATDYTN